MDMFAEILDSSRWTLSSAGGRELFERRFARLFADYVGTSYCVPVDHGSSALVVALQSLGIAHGGLVLVPALTWVSCATAVLRAGLVPVLVDVDIDTGCIGPDALNGWHQAEAVLAVHLGCAMADVPAIAAVADPLNIAVIEDAAQAHGARWRDRSAGSMGTIGCFSMQQGKVLAAGEGGAVVTDDPGLATVLEELRADSRRYPAVPIGNGQTELLETASMMGANFCLDEFNAALLCAQLAELDAQHERRNKNHDLLVELLADVEEVRVVRPRPEQTRMSIYEAPIVFGTLPGDMTIGAVAEALTAELGIPFYPPRSPLNRSRLLRPWTMPSIGERAQQFRELHRGRNFPNSEYLGQHSVLTHHRAFLGTEEDMVDIATAIRKIVATRP
jgi:dTDP-4-amino-4,6-dideoxygalactose transaminase